MTLKSFTNFEPILLPSLKEIIEGSTYNMASEALLDDDTAGNNPSTSASSPTNTSFQSPRLPSMAHAATPAPLHINTQIVKEADVQPDSLLANKNKSPYSSPPALDAKGKHSAPMISNLPDVASNLKDLNQSGVVSDTKDRSSNENAEKVEPGLEKDQIAMAKHLRKSKYKIAHSKDIQAENDELRIQKAQLIKDRERESSDRRAKENRLKKLEEDFDNALKAQEQAKSSAEIVSRKHAESLKAAKNELATLVETCNRCTKELQAAKTEIRDLKRQKEILSRRVEKIVPLTLDNNRLEAQVAKLENEINETLVELERLAEAQSCTPRDVFTDNYQQRSLESAPVSARSTGNFEILESLLPTPSTRSFTSMGSRRSTIMASTPRMTFTSRPASQSSTHQRQACTVAKTRTIFSEPGTPGVVAEGTHASPRSLAQVCTRSRIRSLYTEPQAPSTWKVAEGTQASPPSLPQICTRSSIRSICTKPQAPLYLDIDPYADLLSSDPEHTDRSPERDFPDTAIQAHVTKDTQPETPCPPSSPNTLVGAQSDFSSEPSPQTDISRFARSTLWNHPSPHVSPTSPTSPSRISPPKGVADPSTPLLLLPTIAFIITILAMTFCILLALNERAVWRAANETTRKAFWLLGEGVFVGEEPRWVAKMHFSKQQVLGVERGYVG